MKSCKKFILVPAGGLGNRFQAISSAITFCVNKNYKLEIVWFQDDGMRCDFDELFSLSTSLINVTIRNARGLDFFIYAKPRKGNFWIPDLFQRLLFDIRIYYYKNNFDNTPREVCNDSRLDSYDRIYQLACNHYWNFGSPKDFFVVNSNITKQVDEVSKLFDDSTVGIHIRRTDNIDSIINSPTDLYIQTMKDEIKKNEKVNFYLASDSLEEKSYLIHLFGDKILTVNFDIRRNHRIGIINAFIEMLILARTNRIYASYSTFSWMASKFGNKPLIVLDKRICGNNIKGVNKTSSNHD